MKAALRVLPIALLWSPPPLLAAGTPAGVEITNTASVAFTLGGQRSTLTGNTSTFRVDERVDCNVTWQDAGAVSVRSPDSARLLTFVLTNTGNGSDSYTLSVQNSLPGDQFDPALVDIHLDADGDGLFDPAVDTPYQPGSGDPVLAADATLVVFVRSDIPSGLNGGDLGYSRLVATSNTGTGAPGTAFAGAGDSGTWAVLGASGGRDEADGQFQVAGAPVSLVKSVTVDDPLGGREPMPGATLSYSINVSVTGPSPVSGLVITDPIPANTTYAPGTLTVNGTPLTDEPDDDAGDVGGTRAGAVTVNLGDMPPNSPGQIIRFQVTIN